MSAQLRSVQAALDNAYPYNDAAELRAEQAEDNVRTDEKLMRECVEEAMGTDTAGLSVDALVALRDAFVAGVFTMLAERRPMTVIQTEALGRLHRAARQFDTVVEVEIGNEIVRELARMDAREAAIATDRAGGWE